MKFLIVIPARGGSKGIPRKNLRQMNGKPLIAYSIENAKKIQSKYDTSIVVEFRRVLFRSGDSGDSSTVWC